MLGSRHRTAPLLTFPGTCWTVLAGAVRLWWVAKVSYVRLGCAWWIFAKMLGHRGWWFQRVVRVGVERREIDSVDLWALQSGSSCLNSRQWVAKRCSGLERMTEMMMGILVSNVLLFCRLRWRPAETGCWVVNTTSKVSLFLPSYSICMHSIAISNWL